MANYKNNPKIKINNNLSNISNNENNFDCVDDEKNFIKLKKADFDYFRDLLNDLKTNLVSINEKYENIQKCKNFKFKFLK